MWKKIRVFILLLVLGIVLVDTWREQERLDWQHPLYVAVYPINADQHPQVARYIRQRSSADLQPINDYLQQQAQRYHLPLYRPITLQWGDEVQDVPPAPPTDGQPLAVMLWSLKMRLFAWQNTPDVPVRPSIRLYALFYNPTQHPRLAHSTALAKGQIGRINLFGDDQHTQQNWVVLTHELLHTLRATDKYDLATNVPRDPDGLADPTQVPRYPQHKAELMGGRVAVSPQQAVIPSDLNQTLIGAKTAQEIGWLDSHR
ncbi:MAG: hypothetical protein RLY58_1214 [Pseudomonadota bacterium]|jgi:hypothetical protein